MIFKETELAGAFVIELEERVDERGFFARGYCAEEFTAHGLNPTVVQGNVSFNHKAGTLRGMHFQYPPVAETKFVRCTRGALLDVIVDLRPESPTFGRHVAVELTADNRRGLFVPERFAHGFLTLEDRTEATYLVGEYYTPGYEDGLRYDDPELGINWPIPVAVVSEKDQSWTPFADRRAAITERLKKG